MTNLIYDAEDGDLVAIIYRHDDGQGWLAEVQKRFGGRDSFSLLGRMQARTTTKWGARRAARSLLRHAVRIERARLSKANPILVGRERPSVIGGTDGD